MIIVNGNNHDLEEIVQLDEEDIEAMKDDARAIREDDVQQYKVYAWEQNLIRKHKVCTEVNLEKSSEYIYKSMRHFDMRPPEIYFLTRKQMVGNGGEDNWAGVARGTSIIQLRTDAPPWVAIHEVSHTITNRLEELYETEDDDFDGYKWASHGSVFVGIFAYLMEYHGLWYGLEERDFENLMYLSEIELLEEGWLNNKRHPFFGPDKHLRTSKLLWNEWFCDVPARAKKLIEDVKMSIDGFGSELGKGFVEEYGKPSRHVMPSGQDNDIVKYLVETAHDPAYTCYGIRGLVGFVSTRKELKSIVRANKGVKNIISEITDMCVGELFCQYEELIVDQYLDWKLENEEN